MDTCPYCLSPILENDQSAACDDCGARHHVECLLENGGCAATNCRKQVRPMPIEIEIDAEPRTLLVLSKESVEQARPSRLKLVDNPCIRCGKQLPEGELYCAACTPEIHENRDARNVGPLLTVMIGVIAVVAAVLAIGILSDLQQIGR
jgi:predicted nucleic acid-binding Zn ribbon protein